MQLFLPVLESICSEVALTSKKQEVSLFCLFLKRITLLIKICVKGCRITNRVTEVMATILTNTVYLEELDISHTKLFTANYVKINKALATITSLRLFRMNNNYIFDSTAESITAAVNSNSSLVELNLSNNMFTLGMARIVDTLSKNNTIKILNISNTSISNNNIQNVATALGNCATLQSLDLSKNSLHFNGVLQIVQTMRCHPNLQALLLEENSINVSCLPECEFLVDVILSTNQKLSYLNLCGRNIRPRFTADHLISPCNNTKPGQFVIQNLYLLHYLFTVSSVSHPNETHSNFTKSIENCPFFSNGIASYHVDHTGGTFYNHEHNFVVVIPPGAVLPGETIEIQATASRFGPYQLPKGYCPISSYFWISANYTFKIPVYLILSHHASFKNVIDVNAVCAMESCAQNICTTSDGMLLMDKVLNGVFFDYKIGYCVISANHFCSYCLAKNDVNLPDKFYASCYTYNCNQRVKVEICMCHVNKECIEVCKNLIIPVVYALCRYPKQNHF